MAVRRRQGRLDPVGAKRGGREAEKRVLWGHMAAVYAGRAENSAWVAYVVQQNCTLLVGLKRVSSTHSGKNVAEVVLKTINESGIAANIGCFQADNINNNDTFVEAILSEIALDTSTAHRRVRCWGHIINLAARAFLFGDYPESFKLKIENLERSKLEIRHERELLLT
jgi:hypothetical protein